MELKNMSSEELEMRKAEIAGMVDNEDADLDALTEEVRSINEELQERKNAEAKKEEIRNAVSEGNGEEVESIDLIEEKRNMDNMEIRNTREYINAFAKYVRTEDDRECRALLTENVSGTLPVPEFVYGIVSKEIASSEILNRARHMNAKGNLKVGFEISAPAAEAHTEGDEAIDEEALTLGVVEIVPQMLKKWVSISDEALDLANGEEYLRYIYEEVARGIVRAKEDAIVAAILAAPQTATSSAPAVAKTGTAAGALADFVNARALLSAAARDLCIICTPAQYATYRSLQMAAQYGVDPFDGLPVLFNDTVTAPIIGDLKGVMVNEASDIQLKFDDKTLMTEDLVRILGRQYVGIAVVGEKFFAKVSA